MERLKSYDFNTLVFHVTGSLNLIGLLILVRLLWRLQDFLKRKVRTFRKERKRYYSEKIKKSPGDHASVLDDHHP
jgi:hypothetical protein